MFYALILLTDTISALSASTWSGLAWSYLLFLPVVVALLGRGGKAVYICALIVCWMMIGLVVVALPLEIYLEYFSEDSDQYPSKLKLVEGLFVFIVGMIGFATHFCLTRTHPVATKTILDMKINSLFLGTMRRQAMAFVTNMALLVPCIEADWTFSNIIYVYWFEAILISLFTARHVRNKKLFDTRDPRFADRPVEIVKQEFLDKNIPAYAFFYIMYLGIILFTSGLPEPVDAGFMLLAGVAFFASFLFGSRDDIRDRHSAPVSLTLVESRLTWRLIPMHLGLMLAMISLGDTDHPGLAILFVLLKTLADVGREVTEYRHEKKRLMNPPDAAMTTHASGAFAGDVGQEIGA